MSPSRGVRLGTRRTLEYGVRLGAAGAAAAAIGFAADLEHVGWACAAALMVMRAPRRSCSDFAARAACSRSLPALLLAVGFVRLGPSEAWYGVAAATAVAGAAATHAGRWYLTPAFTTFLVFLLLLYSDPDAAGSRFAERVGETLLGVGLAYAFGLALPALRQR